MGLFNQSQRHWYDVPNIRADYVFYWWRHGDGDPVGAFSVHGVCGVWGTVVIGRWGVNSMDPGAAGIGLLNGGGISQFLIQALGAAAYGIWTVITCWIAWQVIGGFFGGIRVSESEEIQGLDIGEHGMEAYPDFASS